MDCTILSRPLIGDVASATRSNQQSALRTEVVRGKSSFLLDEARANIPFLLKTVSLGSAEGQRLRTVGLLYSGGGATLLAGNDLSGCGIG